MLKAYLFDELTEDLDDVELDGPPPSDLRITGLAYRASTVQAGHLFVCLGRGFIPELKGLDIDVAYAPMAVAAGAAAILLPSDHPQVGDLGVPVLRARRPGRLTARLAARIHGRPTDRLRLVGITGTNGKTTVAAMLRAIYEAAGATPATLGTLGIGSRALERGPGYFTTPPSPELFAAAADLLARGVDTLIMESTSHGLALEREWGVEYDAAVFTNFSPEHLDLHGTLDAYLEIKLGLFRRLRRQTLKREAIAVVNADDPVYRRLAEAARGARIVSYGVRAAADYRASRIEEDLAGVRFDVEHPGGRAVVELAMLGRHNVDNALAAFACAHAGGVPSASIVAGLASMRAVPGRFQPVPGAPCTVLVDFAHSPDALAATLASARRLCRGELWVVFGCGGDRDRSKRSEMGRIAAEAADHVVITSDNPRTEEPGRIIDDIVAGVPESRRQRVTRVADRRQAVFRALADARPDDIVVVAGKGHEKAQIVGLVRHPFDDVEVVASFRRDAPSKLVAGSWPGAERRRSADG